jgi:hypothetical protein
MIKKTWARQLAGPPGLERSRDQPPAKPVAGERTPRRRHRQPSPTGLDGPSDTAPGEQHHQHKQRA